MLIQPPGCHMQ